ncbi:MAG TPA: zf-HC2 domain-containing protein [Pyrinomonadaceae bacterium]|jgi:hypothetical protein
MEFEFDKEIDAILRRARAGEAAASADAHLDADEISAFAENGVSEAARVRFTAHLADCARCRKILSNTILLNSEAAPEAASAAVAARAAKTKTPWYRKLFVFPQLAYTMGAFVLLLSGFFGYLIIQNMQGANSSEVSYSTNRAATDRSSAPANASSAASTTNSSALSNSSVATNSASLPATSNTTTSTTTTNAAPLSAGNTATAAKPAPAEKPVAPQLNAPVFSPQATPAPEADNSLNATKNEAPRDDLAKVSPAAPTAGAAQNRAAEDKQKKVKDLAKSDENEAAVAEQDFRLERKSVPKTAKRQQSEAGAARSVGGKTFNNVGGIWFDSAVGRQKQKSVRRGTEEYRKLEAGLRSIAEQLGGTVVVLWNGKAYRIE